MKKNKNAGVITLRPTPNKIADNSCPDMESNRIRLQIAHTIAVIPNKACTQRLYFFRNLTGNADNRKAPPAKAK